MCGISGLISAGLSEEERRAAVQRMNSSQAHRGPDAEGLWMTGEVCIGHRRLSIIDLSAASNQPLFSPDNRYAIVYNGELYNYRELKLELQRAVQGADQQPYFFKTASDTEVVLAAFIRWGPSCVNRFNGMFAFAVYDNVKSCLTLARDRMGVKPLYYSYGERGLVFASELRALLSSGFSDFQLDEQKIAEYAMYQTVHAPATIVKGIRMLLPGHYAEFSGGKASTTCYYDVNDIQAIQDVPVYEAVCSKVNELLTLAVQRRLVSDVPFGAFLTYHSGPFCQEELIQAQWWD